MKKYDLLEEETQDFLINSFHRIGWIDPFPNEEIMMNNDEDKGVNEMVSENPKISIYPSIRVYGKNSPQQIYIPNKAVMFKIMRACIGI